ncbi:potassium transporter [Rhodobacterales bacterium HKCCE3408]|nr:potassium transporter [Rhodobacterales bacterium HKCCE3408]
MESFLLQATIYLVAMVIAVPLSVRLGLGSVLGYLIAGIMIGPVLGLVGAETQDLQHFAEFGVVMMLFLIGLELDPRGLWEMRHRLLGLGGAQILLSIGALAAIGIWLGYAWQVSLAAGMILALSSTAIVLQTLTEKKLMQTSGGRSAFSVLLTQDIAVIPMLTVMPLLAIPGAIRANEDGSIARPTDAAHDPHHTGALFDSLPGWGQALATFAAVVVVIAVGHYLLGYLFRFVHLARLREMYTAFALVIVVGIAYVMILVGLSPALGAFIAGVVLANSEFKHELEANVEPFKGLLLGLFFITVGAGINIAFLSRNLPEVLGTTIVLMLVKGLILFAIGLVARLRGRNLWLFTLGLAQAGEFGFVLISFANQVQVLPVFIGERLLLAVALSMLLTPVLFILYEMISARTTESQDAAPAADKIDQTAPIIIAGIGRFGQVVHRMVQASGLKTVILDSDMATIRLMREFGFKAYFGDPTRSELLHAAGLDKAKILVVAVDDRKAAVSLVKYARSERPDILITARAHDRLHVYELYNAGADHIVRETFDSSLRAARYVLEDMGFTEYEAHELETAFYHHDRQNLRELAELWKPDVPIEKNPAYLARARELNANLETALVTQLDEAAGAGPDDEPAGRRKRGDAGALSGTKARRPGGLPAGRGASTGSAS